MTTIACGQQGTVFDFAAPLGKRRKWVLVSMRDGEVLNRRGLDTHFFGICKVDGSLPYLVKAIHEGMFGYSLALEEISSARSCQGHPALRQWTSRVYWLCDSSMRAIPQVTTSPQSVNIFNAMQPWLNIVCLSLGFRIGWQHWRAHWRDARWNHCSNIPRSSFNTNVHEKWYICGLCDRRHFTCCTHSQVAVVGPWRSGPGRVANTSCCHINSSICYRLKLWVLGDAVIWNAFSRTSWTTGGPRSIIKKANGDRHSLRNLLHEKAGVQLYHDPLKGMNW